MSYFHIQQEVATTTPERDLNFIFGIQMIC